jgi:hypothetical protein
MLAMLGLLDAEEYLRLTDLELEASVYNAKWRKRNSRRVRAYHRERKARLT